MKCHKASILALCFVGSIPHARHLALLPALWHLQRRLAEIEKLEAAASGIMEEVARRAGISEAAEGLWARWVVVVLDGWGPGGWLSWLQSEPWPGVLVTPERCLQTTISCSIVQHLIASILVALPPCLLSAGIRSCRGG
jgi:hypothetical protein